ncbi:MAG TPA: protein kinase [Enhygromyxa sp.]|nr:protein kinase [Enhygromyxa sp.]
MEDSGSALSQGTVFETGDGAASGEPASLERGDMLSRYMLVERVGLGGMGVVWSAYDPELDRKLAIKLLRPRNDRGLGDLARTRLIREAQVMARINHPNVLKVHDVGEHDGQVFLAMEFVQGKTLGRWVRATRRSWREIVAMFVQAGRGLAAAHRVDLVHRDFKPANVLIGPDGRARVLDFGLARSVERDDDELPVTRTWSASRMQRFDPNPLVTPLTRTGSMLGTPAYMAPEQFEGAQFDARTDQFSFCVALWEALHHRRPFAGATIDDLRQSVCSGKIVAPPSDSRVPGVIDRALRRGLSVDPSARWPSMDALLDELSRDPAVGRRRWLIAVGLVASFSAAWFVAPMLEDEPVLHDETQCPNPRDNLRGIWDPQRRDELGRSIGGAHPERWGRIVAVLDDYASGYVTVRKQRCEAGLDLDTDPGARCLDHRLRWLAGTVELLDSGDAHMIEGAEGLLAALPPIEACARSRYVEAAGFARSESVRDDTPTNARGRMLAARARAELGEIDQAANQLRELLREAEAIDHPPLRIAILIELAYVEQRAGAAEQARLRLEQAVNEATRNGYDVLAANAARRLIEVVGRDLKQPEVGLRWAARAEAWDERIDAPALHRAERLVAEGELRSALADPAAAARIYASALELLEVGEGELDAAMHDPAEARIVSRAFVGLAELALARGEHREAWSRLVGVHALREASLGPEHVETARVALELAVIEATLGDWRAAASRFAVALPQLDAEARARAMLEHARLRLLRAELIPDELGQAESLLREAVEAAPSYAGTLALAQLERVSGQLEQAELRLASLAGVVGLEVAVTLERGELRLAQADPEQALAEFDRAASMLGERDQPSRAEALAGKGRALLLLGREAEGLAALQGALAIWDELAAKGHPRSVVTLELLASASGPESRYRSRAEAIRAGLL